MTVNSDSSFFTIQNSYWLIVILGVSLAAEVSVEAALEDSAWVCVSAEDSAETWLSVPPETVMSWEAGLKFACVALPHISAA